MPVLRVNSCSQHMFDEAWGKVARKCFINRALLIYGALLQNDRIQ